MNQPTPSQPHQSDATPRFRYTAALANAIETRWQTQWSKDGAFVTPNPGQPGFDAARPKFFCLDMFPYPSGAGLHVGHPEGYTATDIICRYKRMKGFNVLHPMGWDAFGLPAEQYAIQTGVHPAITTRKAIDTFRAQLQRFGFSYDWSREFATIDPDYYKWTQWIFLQIYNSWYDRTGARNEPDADTKEGRARPIGELIEGLERGVYGVDTFGEIVAIEERPAMITGAPVGVRMWHELSQPERRAVIDGQRLAYLGEQTVNWCPKLGTALANEEVIDGKSERGSFPVYRKPLRQWMFRITAYAHRLLADLDAVDWPASTKTMQSEWIGKSEGAEIDFPVSFGPEDEGDSLRIYTTRPDTIFGATYMVIAPEHPLVSQILEGPDLAPPGTDLSAIGRYVSAARNRSDVDRQADTKQKTGVFSGLHATNPATGESIPIWIADYVLMGYGHGAIMAVPAHDERDFEFARAFGLPIRDVVYPRPIQAMVHFAQHAPPELRAEARWLGALADLIGYVTSNNLARDRFDEALRIIATRRRADEASTVSIDAASDRGVPQGELNKRGLTRTEWIDTIEEMGIRTLDDLTQRVRAASFHDKSDAAFTGPGFAANSRNDEVYLDGLGVDEAKRAIVAWLEKSGLGRARTNYRLRDWLFSRQRYWGEPFPIVFDEQGEHHAVGEDALPVRLPELADYQPIESEEPMPLLAKATSWVRTTAGEARVPGLPASARVTRETNTMPGWAGSCWYYLRYCDPKNAARFVGEHAESYWMTGSGGGVPGVDLYIGGAEHAVLHLLYARFWHKVLYDLGHVSTKEPFAKLFHQGLITAYSYQRPDRTLVPNDQVEERTDASGKVSHVERATGQPVTPVIAKMSKSLKNVINPDDVIAEYGADTFRLYEMYMGPLEASKPWNPRDITGCFRFLQRAWRLMVNEETGDLRVGDGAGEVRLERELHRLTQKVGEDIERLSFNTAIAGMMTFVNTAGAGPLSRAQIERFTLVLAPFCPHIAQDLWERLGRTDPLLRAPWPSVDPAMLVDDQVEIPVQIGGKVRGRVTVPANADAKSIEAAAMAEPKVQEWIAGKGVKKIIVVPGKMVNIVTG